MNLLYVEDDLVLRRTIVPYLEDADFSVTIAQNGEEALERFHEKTPDVILLDILLPKMDGFEVLQRIKQDPKGKNVKVIILSNLGSREDMDKGKLLGADSHLVKAYSFPEDILKKINEVTGRKF